jgi:hypothetical protein
MAEFNAQMIMSAAGVNDTGQQQIAQYNANLQSFLGDYNASLLETEVGRIWEALDLDILQMEQQFARERGDIEVGYGASGVMMNQDSPLTAVIDARTQQELDLMIVRHNADIQASKLLDAAAKGRWEGNMAAASIMFESKISSSTNYANAVLSAMGTVAQGTIDSKMTLYNTGIGAEQTRLQGVSNYSTYKSQDQQALANGLFQAGSTWATYKTNVAQPSLPQQPQQKTASPILRTSGTPTRNVQPYQQSPAIGSYSSPLFRN